MATDINAASERVWSARQAGDFCPAWLPGALTLGEALEVQLRMLDRELAAGRELAGWKVGLTSPRARAALGADVRPFGYILADRVFGGGAEIDAASICRPSIEAELCFTVGSELAGSATSTADVRAAMSQVAAGFEVNERRPGSVRPDLPAMATDCMSNWGIVVGDAVPLGMVADLNAIGCRLERGGQAVYTGVSRDELDDHIESLRALVAGLAEHGRGLLPGQRVITGAFTRFEAAAGEHWRATYTSVGAVEATFR